MQKWGVGLFAALFLLFMIPQGYAEDISTDCKEVFPGFNGPVNERINLVFISYNYPSKEEFLNQVKPLVSPYTGEKSFLTISPLSSNKEKFNFWFVDTLVQAPTVKRPFFQIPLEDADFYSQRKWSTISEKCLGIPAALKLSVPMINEDFSIKVYGASLENVQSEGETGAIIVPHNSQVNAGSFFHEFLHAFGKHLDEYAASGNGKIIPSKNAVNCDKVSSDNACLSWFSWR